MITHFTASGIVQNVTGEFLLVRNRNSSKWLYPGGHIDDNEAPHAAALREVVEETALTPVIHSAWSAPILPLVDNHPLPYVVIEMSVEDAEMGPHRHLDFVYLMTTDDLAIRAQPGEVAEVRWFTLHELDTIALPGELPYLFKAAAGRFGELGQSR